MALSPPPQIRDTLVHHLYLKTEKQKPDAIFAKIINGDVLDPVANDITWSQLMRDVCSVTSQLKSSIRPRTSGTPMKVVSVLARSGYSYLVHLLAIISCGWTAALLSTKNSPAALEHLIEASHSQYVLVDQDSRALIEGCLLMIPCLDFFDLSLLDGGDSLPPTQPESTVVESELDVPALYLHTSGSTGHPKLVPWTHRFISHAIFSYLEATEEYKGCMFYCLAPICHAMGAMFALEAPLAFDCPILFAESKKPITGEALLRHIRPFSNVALIPIPSILQQVADSGPEAMRELASHLKVAYYGGAGLDVDAGNLLRAHGVPVISGFGMAEINIGCSMLIPHHNLDNGEWLYFQWRKGYKILMIDSADEPDIKECIVLPAEDTPAIINHRDPIGFRTGDLWKENPHRSGWWKHVGRVGDVTVLANGEKTNNKQLETLLLRDPRIDYVIVFGEGKEQNGLLLSPAPVLSSPAAFEDEIWPLVQRINEEIPKHSRINRELILVATPTRPFALTDKGTVRAKATLAMYEKDIEEAYRTMDMDDSNLWTFDREFNLANLTTNLSAAIGQIMSRKISVWDDLFEQGLDSFLAFRVAAVVRGAARASSYPDAVIPRNVVYVYPSVAALASYVHSLVPSTAEPVPEDDATAVEMMIEKYSANFVVQNPNPTGDLDGIVVALTGATGSVGSFIFAELLVDPKVQLIYSLYRPSVQDIGERQLKSFVDRGLDSSLLQEYVHKIRFVAVDLAVDRLGLDEALYDEIARAVTHIIHPAWHVNFNLSLQSFERTHIVGVRNLIDLALLSHRRTRPRFIFLSSVASVAGYSGPSGVPEETFNNPQVARTGYGMSKYAAERILDRAVIGAGLNAVVIRLGQLCGATIGTGAWSPSEYIPIILRSSQLLGSIPSDLPDQRWLPVDIASKAVILLSFNSSATVPAYYHVENPKPTPWREIVGIVADCCIPKLQLVPMDEWLEYVAQRSKNLETSSVPASALYDFFANRFSTPPLITDRTLSLVPSVNFGSIPGDLIQHYLHYLGLIPDVELEDAGVD